MEIKPRTAMKSVHLRLPGTWREIAREIALKNGVKEAEVYRSVLAIFFVHDVNNLDTYLTTNVNEGENPK